MLGEQNVAGAEGLGHPVDDAAGIVQIAGQHQMADDHAAAQEAVFHHIGPGLAEHLLYGSGRHGKIIRRGGELGRQCAVGIFQVGEPDIHQPLQRTQGLHPFVAAAVVDQRHGELGLQRREDPGQEVGGCDEVDVVGALGDQLLKDGAETLGGHILAEALRRDGVILAVDAAQGAAGEKHRAGAVGAGDRRLLPVVEGGAGNAQSRGHGAEAVSPIGGTRRAAVAGTEAADHRAWMSKSGPRSPAIQWRRHRPMYLSLAPSTTCAPSFTT